MGETCGTCKFHGYGRTSAEVHSNCCRRHAPLITGGLHTDAMTVWPKISVDDWCGEYQPRQPTTPTAEEEDG